MATYGLDENYDRHSIQVELAENGFVVHVSGKTYIAANGAALQKFLREIGSELIQLQGGDEK